MVLRTFLLCLIFFVAVARADQDILKPTFYRSGSAMTVKSGVHVTFEAGSFLNVTGATVDGITYSMLGGRPTTIAGYGITDFNSLGDARWSLLGHAHTFASLTSKPTTLLGYGITDAQPLGSDLTAIEALSGTNTIYYRSASNTWTAVTIGANMAFSGGILSATSGPGGGATIDNVLNLIRGDGIGNGVDSGIDPDDVALVSETEPALGNPATNGYILSSTTGGVRSWIVPPTGGGELVDDLSPQLGGNLDLNGHIITGMVIGTNIQAFDSDLELWRSITPGAGWSTLLAATKPTTVAGYGITDAVSSITLSGDVTGTGTGSITATIPVNTVTNAKAAQMATHTFKGNNTASTADAKDLTIAETKSELNLTGTNGGDQTIVLTGQVTGTGTGSFAATLNKTAITSQTEDTTPDLAADFILTSDTSNTGSLRKVKPASIITQAALTKISSTASVTGRTTTISTTAFPISGGGFPPAGLYRVSYYTLATTAGTSGSLDVVISWNDGTADRTCTKTSALTFGITEFATKAVLIRADGAHAISYGATVVSPVGSPVYSFFASLERLL